MKIINIKIIVLYLTVSILSIGIAQAEQYLSADKLKSAIIGKTFYAEHLKKGFKFKVYFDVDGSTAYRTTSDGISKTSYKFDGDKHCILWKDVDRCAKILDKGDGTYIRVKNGNHIMSWYKVVQGRDL
ncbi:MAG: hypothetical protein ACC653_11115 [Gammaproteobacteria bacterium]